jgi:hypothetical protein
VAVLHSSRHPIDESITQLSYKHGDKELFLEPLKGQVDPEKSDFTVGKVKVEIRLVKAAEGRWGGLVGNTPDSAYISLHNLSTYTYIVP